MTLKTDQRTLMQLSAAAHQRLLPKLPALIYGGDYNPEQWPEAIWPEDARLMREAGVNLVSLGVFAWGRIQPRPGSFDLAWLDRVMDLLAAHDVFVNLATATASPPPWLARLYPESLPVTDEGARLSPGSRQAYCPSSSAYRAAATLLTASIAERYANHPALAAWHVGNEYGCHVGACYCDTCAVRFRRWLQRRYGELDALNAAWGTAFWSQHYGDWAEINPPRRAPYIVNPTQQLDWRRFSSANILELFTMERDILRRHTPDIPIATNFMGFFKPLDYWAWAAEEDFVALDYYPDPADPEAAQDAAMTYDLTRSLGRGRPWVLMEQAAGHVNWRPRNATKAPGAMRLGSYQAIARGADGVMFFQWRASRAGGEQFHSAMLPHGGTDTRTFREVAALGGELPALPVPGGQVATQVAILFDWESWWALELEGKPSEALRALPILRDYYAPLFARNLAVDFIRPGDDLRSYRVVLAPNLFLCSEVVACSLSSYVQGGGTLVVGCFSAVVDEQMHVWPGGHLAPFREALGIRVEEIAPSGDDAPIPVATSDGTPLAARAWADVVALEGAEPLAHFAAGFYAGRPAMTRNRFGQGLGYYIATWPDQAGLAWLLEQIYAEAGLRADLVVPPGVELVRRETPDRTLTYLLNHTGERVAVELPEPLPDRLRAEQSPGLTLEAYAVAILETSTR